MDLHFKPGDFSGLCRLFPLPGVVLFPNVILPLHVFEPRYRQMTQDALDGDRLIAMVQACPADQGNPGTEPVPIADVACLGKIIQHERQPDGRMNILLLGCKRVRLVREVAGAKLYRIAEASVLEDEELCDRCDPRREELIGLFLEILRSRHGVAPDLSQLLESDISPGILSDIVAHALDLPPAAKQALLEEVRVDRRLTVLLSLLRGLRDPSPGPRRFPRPFSLN